MIWKGLTLFWFIFGDTGFGETARRKSAVRLGLFSLFERVGMGLLLSIEKWTLLQVIITGPP